MLASNAPVVVVVVAENRRRRRRLLDINIKTERTEREKCYEYFPVDLILFKMKIMVMLEHDVRVFPFLYIQKVSLE